MALTLAFLDSIFDAIAILTGLAALIIGVRIVNEVEGEGDLKSSMIFATIATFFFTLTQVIDYVGETFYDGAEIFHLYNRISFLIGIILLFFAGRVILRFFKGISFKR